MEFYDVLSTYYDDIFKPKKEAVSLIKEEIPAGQSTRILDLAAGTGGEAILLAEASYDITAVDMNKDMVKILRDKNERNNLPMKVIQMAMEELGELPGPGYEGIYCIGNSFVHIESRTEMVNVLKGVYERLNKGGVFILQTVNYDRIFAREICQLPVIRNKEKGIIFERFYDWNAQEFLFQMKLMVEKNGGQKVYRSETSLLPLKEEDFKSLVEASPFNGFKVYGSFNKTTFTEDSPALVAVLRKD
ncbi:class I SAM-dependent methyltransferase [Salipaludibacillus aurantiacus]|uniref:Ubiquinone/menaquinone biosynthesis C-methylase UbiE n=1 Tax=Salipaludibacillus aurantiacus TaxID=1601833 RepID=A0A1H9UYV1_9BACI|nr:class I SAM-dependent methyltransferase [Salipaludibacillus aurantiacus]SES14501.1 Ubiquinone/menaquinone biosynthesis C-methylase UbiE [Salipaludibacillus aurantiacus]